VDTHGTLETRIVIGLQAFGHHLNRTLLLSFINFPTHFMAIRTPKKKRSELDKPDHVFDKAAELFRVMSAPMRLKIISCLCDGEQNVSYLLEKITTTQPNMSQHLNTLYKAGVLAKRRDGVQIHYRIANAQIVNLCRAVCIQVEEQSGL
jgi:ArsR family transcriptional regulator